MHGREFDARASNTWARGNVVSTKRLAFCLLPLFTSLSINWRYQNGLLVSLHEMSLLETGRASCQCGMVVIDTTGSLSGRVELDG